MAACRTFCSESLAAHRRKRSRAARAVEDANAQISLCHLKHTTCATQCVGSLFSYKSLNPSVLKVKRQQHHDSHPISATPRSPGMCQCETGGQYDIRVNYGIAAMRAYGRGHVVCAVALPPS